MSYAFTFQRLSESFVLRRLSMSSALYFSWTIRVLCQDYQSLLYFSKTIRYQSLLSCRDYQCHPPLLFKDYHSLLSCGDYQCHLPLLFKEYQSLLSCGDCQCHLLFTFPRTIRVLCQDYQSLLYFSKTIKAVVLQRC